MPPYRRDMPAWSAASRNDFHLRTTSRAGTPGLVAVLGSNSEVPALTVICPPKLSLPVKAVRVMRAAPLKVECPEVYSGNGGVTPFGSWYGRHWLPSTRP